MEKQMELDYIYKTISHITANSKTTFNTVKAINSVKTINSVENISMDKKYTANSH